MQNVTYSLKGLCFAAVTLALVSTASAQEGPSPSQPAADAEVLSAEDLEALAGGTGVTAIANTEQVLNAVNTGNTVSAEVVNSGQINVGANAFSGYAGVGNFVLNTGHNNNLQSSMNVSIVLAPPTAP
jgi:hypothetical protein